MNLIDLHIHSTFSDGSLSPAELLKKAHGLGLKAIAITDHDTLAGIDIFKKNARHNSIKIITGVELSASHEKHSIHILGYGFNPLHPSLLDGLKNIQQARVERNLGIIEKLSKLGIAVSLDDLAKLAKEQIGRPHFAQILFKNGVIKNQEEAFRHFLGKTGKAFVARKKFPAQEAIKMIKSAGGRAFLAHPGTLDANFNFLPGLIVSLKKIGLDGLEAFHPSHTSYMANKLLSFGRKENLLLSCGTDFHASPSWEALLARVPVPASLQLELLNWIDTFQ